MVARALLGATGLHRLTRALPALSPLLQGGGGALFTKLVLGIAILLLTAATRGSSVPAC